MPEAVFQTQPVHVAGVRRDAGAPVNRHPGFRSVAACLLIAFAAACCTAAAAGPAQTPTAGSFHTNFHGLKLQDQDERALDPARWGGRIVLVNFVYTGCSTTCPVQTRALAELQRQLPPPLRSRVHLLSVSLDPRQDTPAALKAYARRMGADLTGWSFATGRPQDIERLSEALRLFRPGADVRKLEDHSTALWLVDAKGELRMRYAGNPPDVARLLREISALDALATNPKT